MKDLRAWLIGKTTGRVALVAPAVAAVAVYAHSLLNRWALDDHGIIVDNPATHSFGAALRSFFDPYWPEALEVYAGMHRPLTILSYGLDYSLSGGAPWWFHLVNVVLHALATVLVVLVMRRWLAPFAAMIVGLVFAVHPVHVEAVANVVGRAEVLAAVFLLAAVLSARRYRREEDDRSATRWLVATVTLSLLAMLSKEHGVAAIGVIAVDHWLESDRRVRSSVPLYATLFAVSMGWFYVWSSIASAYVGSATAANFRGLTEWQRLATALPVQFDLLRLLILPLDLSPDYNPQMIPQRFTFGPLAVGGLIIALTILAMGFATVRKAPAVAFCIFVAVGTYAPTSNILYSSGTALAERALYLAVLIPAVWIAWVVENLPKANRRIVLGAAAALLAVYVARTVTRVPFWSSMRNVITTDIIQHPHNYRSYVRVASTFELLEDSTRALQYYNRSAALFENDPYIALRLVPLASGMGRPYLALHEARRSLALDPDHSDLNRLAVDAFLAVGLRDSALAVSRRYLDMRLSLGSMGLYRDVLVAVEAPAWQAELASARLAWIEGRPRQAQTILEELRIPVDSLPQAACWDIAQAEGVILSLNPGLLDQAAEAARISGTRCDVFDI